MRPIPAKASGLGLEDEKEEALRDSPHRSAPGSKGSGAERWGMVIVYFLLAYEHLGRCPRLVWVGPLALKPDHIPYHHPGIRDELIEMRIKKATMSTMVALIVLKTRSALWRALGRNARSSLGSRNNL